jgi:hypothetical protein
MKNLLLSAVGILAIFCFVVNQNVRTGVIDEVKGMTSSNTKEVADEPSNEPIDMSNFSQEAQDYFNEICRGSEFGGGGTVSKWRSDVKIFVTGDKREYLMDELKRIVNELNEYIDPINIKIVNSRSEANYIILFGSAQEYVRLEPIAKDYVGGNFGLFVVNGGSTITDGTMYVDIFRTESITAQKHLLREELTQSLGFKKDSYTYPESMFYQVWSETTEYSPIDIEIIKMLYN